jgi:hypothetical protein
VQRSLGTPSTKDWPGLANLPDYNKITFLPMKPQPFEHVIPHCSSSALGLARKFLLYNPDSRIDAKTVNKQKGDQKQVILILKKLRRH